MHAEPLIPAASALAPALFALSGTICGVLILLGTLLATSDKRCSIYWLSSMTLSAVGWAVVAGMDLKLTQYVFVVKAAAALLLTSGYMFAWWGLRIFFDKPHPVHKGGLVLIGVTTLVYAALLQQGAPVPHRLTILSCMAAITWCLCLNELLGKRERKRKFADFVAIGAMFVLITTNLLRIQLFLGPDAPMTGAHVVSYTMTQAWMMYILPMVGSLLLPISTALLHLNRMIERADHTATHDGLTGLLNRRALVAVGQREIAEAGRLGMPLAVAFIDIDYFKKINDQYGHDHGDLVLREVALILHENCRGDDFLGRYGGEEFCAVFPGDDLPAACQAGQRLVAQIRQHHFAELPQVTISVGMAVLQPRDPQRDWHALVKRADAELYRAKHGGRDQYRIEGGEPAVGFAS